MSIARYQLQQAEESARAFQSVAQMREQTMNSALDLLEDFYNRQRNECDPSWTRFRCRVYDLLRYAGRVK